MTKNPTLTQHQTQHQAQHQTQHQNPAPSLTPSLTPSLAHTAHSLYRTQIDADIKYYTLLTVQDIMLAARDGHHSFNISKTAQRYFKRHTNRKAYMKQLRAKLKELGFKMRPILVASDDLHLEWMNWEVYW